MDEATWLDIENIRMRNEIYAVIEYIEDRDFLLNQEKAERVRDELLRITDGL